MTTFLVAIEAVAIVVMALLVLGLLRSHAEILERLDVREHDEETQRLRMEQEALGGEIALPSEASPDRRAHDLAGVTLVGDFLKIGVRAYPGNTLLAFLSSGCSICEDFWKEFRSGKRQAPGHARIVVVTKDASQESPARLRELAGSVEVLMSSEAWDAYEITIAPYFVYVNGVTGRVAGEGAARSWAQLESMIGDAVADEEVLSEGSWWRPRRRFRRAARPETPAERDARAVAALAAAGIGPGHPSLYPQHEAEHAEQTVT